MNDVKITIQTGMVILHYYHSPAVPAVHDVIVIGEKRYRVEARVWHPLMVAVEVTPFVQELR